MQAHMDELIHKHKQARILMLPASLYGGAEAQKCHKYHEFYNFVFLQIIWLNLECILIISLQYTKKSMTSALIFSQVQ